MKEPTEKSWRDVQESASYLLSTANHGVRHKRRTRIGESILTRREWREGLGGEDRALEVLTDAAMVEAGTFLKSVGIGSLQIFLDGNLVEPKVRSQKNISPCLGESAFPLSHLCGMVVHEGLPIGAREQAELEQRLKVDRVAKVVDMHVDRKVSTSLERSRAYGYRCKQRT